MRGEVRRIQRAAHKCHIPLHTSGNWSQCVIHVLQIRIHHQHCVGGSSDCKNRHLLCLLTSHWGHRGKEGTFSREQDTRWTKHNVSQPATLQKCIVGGEEEKERLVGLILRCLESVHTANSPVLAFPWKDFLIYIIAQWQPLLQSSMLISLMRYYTIFCWSKQKRGYCFSEGLTPASSQKVCE